MTLAEHRRIKRRRESDSAAAAGTADAPAAAITGEGAPPVSPARERAHPGPREYVQIGLALAIVTAIEVGVYYLDIRQGVLAGILVVLSAIKFSLVALWFMHLRFDSRIFSTMFVGGLALAVAIFIVVLATLRAGLL